MKENWFDNGSNFLMATPGDTVKIRMGIVKNYPKADLQFWKEALEIDAKNRWYHPIQLKDVAAENEAILTYKISRSRVYALAVKVYDEDIVVVEMLFNNKNIYSEYSDSINQFVKSLRWQ